MIFILCYRDYNVSWCYKYVYRVYTKLGLTIYILLLSPKKNVQKAKKIFPLYFFGLSPVEGNISGVLGNEATFGNSPTSSPLLPFKQAQPKCVTLIKLSMEVKTIFFFFLDPKFWKFDFEELPYILNC